MRSHNYSCKIDMKCVRTPAQRTHLLPLGILVPYEHNGGELAVAHSLFSVFQRLQPHVGKGNKVSWLVPSNRPT